MEIEEDKKKDDEEAKSENDSVFEMTTAATLEH